ncbi:MAG: Zn-dependent hydrolase [Planctomycetota bacterium]|nr:MAG: Zn-dependent hydrolase [Planctomycetota bacterium]
MAQDSIQARITMQQDPPEMARLVAQYVPVRLEADLSHLSPNQREMIRLLIEAARHMDACFWIEAYGDPQPLLESLPPLTRRYAEMNYGPWDRLDGNRPFVPGVGAKPLGANFYPPDMTKEEFERADLPGKDSLYTILRRNDRGELIAIPYHEFFSTRVRAAADLLRQAARLAESSGFRRYLEMRADALLTDDYQPSDLAWLDMRDNQIDVVIGPIETYEDRLFEYKAAHECYVLLKDLEWSERLERYAQFLPWLQDHLPVPEEYRQEEPGTDTDLNAYDALYYAGDCNAGSKTIAINLPNDEEVQLRKGTRRLQLKNSMRAKFDKILVPIANELLVDDQAELVNFDAFFANTMFHEVAHGLGIKRTLNGRGTVREALQAFASTIEEGKADILGLHMIQQLHQRGEIEGNLHAYYVTFMAGIFRSVRFGAASAHGRANMIRFNFFQEQGAFSRSPGGKYRVHFDRFADATQALAARLLTIQGDGDQAAARHLVETLGQMPPQLQSDLDRLNTAGIPVDVVFEQGPSVLGLE